MMPAPRSPYAAAKLAQEYYAAAFTRCHGLDTVSLRLFNVFGPRQNPDSAYAAAIPKFIRRMRSGLRPAVHGDGGQTRDFTYVENVAGACIAAALAPAPLGGEVANIGCGQETSLNALVAELNRILGTDLAPEYLPPRAGDILRSRADIAKAGALFGYAPRVGVREGLTRTAAWMEGRE
jgi:UDP-glucose 4-epimerase